MIADIIKNTFVLTEEQIEKAARKYCELAKLDAEKIVNAPSPVDERGYTYDTCIKQKQWQEIAVKIREQNLLNEAIFHVKYSDHKIEIEPPDGPIEVKF